MTSPLSTYQCVDCKLTISKCHCETIDICKKTDICMAFLTTNGEYHNCKGDKKLRIEFFKYFKPRPKIVFKKKIKCYKCSDCDSWVKPTESCCDENSDDDYDICGETGRDCDIRNPKKGCGKKTDETIMIGNISFCLDCGEE